MDTVVRSYKIKIIIFKKPSEISADNERIELLWNYLRNHEESWDVRGRDYLYYEPQMISEKSLSVL